MHPVLREVAAALGNKTKGIKMGIDKNKHLAEAPHLKGLPSSKISGTSNCGQTIEIHS